MTDARTIRELEEVSLNAWPALRQVLLDGWVVRFAGGYTGRSNSVNPLYPGTGDLRAKVRQCERLYAAAGLPTTFKLTAASLPDQLSAFLRDDGYAGRNGASVQVCDLAAAAATVPNDAPPAADAPADKWAAAVCAFNGVPAAHQSTFRAIIDAIALPRRLVAVMESGEIVACGLGVCQPHVGLVDVVTRVDRRRRGYGRRVIGTLMDWGRRAGARTAYLQVMSGNAAARSVYERTGFREAYPYRYLAKPNQ